ncbi:MAG: hypothetical protein OEZ43_17465 [Gammaproteobacteria bacterium]|nr:hypothetical protein [Gammaproteobacteria bacterium]
MFKTLLYLGLYGSIASIGWFIYDSMENNEKPMQEIQARINTLTNKLSEGDNKVIYRWKGDKGQWVYGNKVPKDRAHLAEEYDYRKELELLRSLPKEALPVQSNIQGEEKEVPTGEGFVIPGIPSLDQVAKLLEGSTNIEQKQQERLNRIDRALQEQ